MTNSIYFTPTHAFKHLRLSPLCVNIILIMLKRHIKLHTSNYSTVCELNCAELEKNNCITCEGVSQSLEPSLGLKCNLFFAVPILTLVFYLYSPSSMGD